MQCGAPVITSNTSSLPEVVSDAGFLINPTDTQAISQAMLALYQNKENLRNQLRQKSLARAKKFSWDAFVMETYRIYTKIV
jgi:glycosyltransferase involved in cell wall biosynthesis